MRVIIRIIAIAALTSILIFSIGALPTHGETTTQTIFIKPDGSVEPSTAPIARDGDTYTFTDNAYNPLVIQKPGITIDGAGHSLQGRYNGTKEDEWMIGDGPTNGTKVLWTIGIDMAMDMIGNLTIKNLKIQNFSIGMYLWTPGNTITGNTVQNTIVGILLSGNDNTMSQNRIQDNDYGVFFGSNNPSGNVPSNIDISLNRFARNDYQLSGCICKTLNTTEAPHTWDNGKKGNYWADYNGTDSDKDGIGDTPYTIDSLNIDRYPLVYDPTEKPTINPQSSTIIIIAGAAIVVGAAAVAILVKSRNKKK